MSLPLLDDGYDELLDEDGDEELLLLEDGDSELAERELLLEDELSGYELELLELLGVLELLGLLPIVSCDEVLVPELVSLPGDVVGDCARTTEANPTAAASPRVFCNLIMTLLHG